MPIHYSVKYCFFILTFIFTAGMAVSQTAINFTLTSTAFENGKPIPARYTCEGTNVSMPLSWSGAPSNTKSFALIMDDPDVPVKTWVHWVAYNIPCNISKLDENKNVKKVNGLNGLNSWEEPGYNGPCAPGGTHHYHFRIYALDILLPLQEKMSKEQLMEAMKTHILAEITLIGLFGS